MNMAEPCLEKQNQMTLHFTLELENEKVKGNPDYD